MTHKQRAETVGERLVHLRGLMMHILLKDFRLSLADAEDVYSESCIYMLGKGCMLIDVDKDFDAAIKTTVKRRALNRIRDSKRMQVGIFSPEGEDYGYLADDREDPVYIEQAIDREKVMSLLKLWFILPSEQAVLGHLDKSINMRHMSELTGYNIHTLTGAPRRMRQFARDL